ncbi:hypothetical protein M569_07212 [Genlisea aurea]|uniref:CCZ1/INTU/HSP4 first Longin domain-containing protein n=1 Tax=Genlisea aurea TaxID=192259 RepID=S8CK50_9LAMI|nr:hypothetical protein M569_07212 [Genlisea aurea]
MQLCVFDLRRGQTEGQELDKILFFYPSDVSIATRLSVIGLSEGLITFTRIFSPETPCESIKTQMHSHVFYEAEPQIWMVMIVEEDENSEYIRRVDCLREVLNELHSLFVMFNGSIRSLADKEPTGALVRTHLHCFIMDFLSDYFVGKKLVLPDFRDSLKECRTLQMITAGREAALDVQSLVRVLESCAGNAKCYTLVLFQDLMVSTNLSSVDSVRLFTYAVLRLTPQALSRPYSHSKESNSSPGAVLDQYHHHNSHDAAGRNSSYSVLRPLQRGKWFKGEDGFLLTDTWGLEVDGSMHKSPTIWLHETEEKMYMLVYQHRSLTAVLLMPVSSINGEPGIARVKQQIIEHQASMKIFKVEEKLSRGWAGENAYHVSGYRYLMVDRDGGVSRATPPGKVTTLTKESLGCVNKLRSEVDWEKRRGNWRDVEICLRAKNNAWHVGRLTGGKELYVVLEKGAHETLLYASDAVERFSDRYCGGAFSLN